MFFPKWSKIWVPEGREQNIIPVSSSQPWGPALSCPSIPPRTNGTFLSIQVGRSLMVLPACRPKDTMAVLSPLSPYVSAFTFKAMLCPTGWLIN